MTAFVTISLPVKLIRKGQHNISGLTQGGFNNNVTDSNRQLAYSKF